MNTPAPYSPPTKQQRDEAEERHGYTDARLQRFAPIYASKAYMRGYTRSGEECSMRAVYTDLEDYLNADRAPETTGNLEVN